jgi:GNAT superfamily N-acetyltransferase
LIIAILKKSNKKLYINLSPYNIQKSTEKEFKLTAYYKENHKKREEVGDLEYTLKIKDGFIRRIHVDNMDVAEHLQKKGYGRILISFCQAIAQASNLKITLFSLIDVVGFYKKCGFHPECKDSQDMVWFPKKRRKKNDKRTKR